MAEVIRGLAYLHSLGIQHGNVANDQVMLTTSGEVKLAGFYFATDMLGATQLPNATDRKHDQYNVSNSKCFGYDIIMLNAMIHIYIGRHFVTWHDAD